MTTVLLSGCGGKMGHVITESISGREDCRIVAGLDLVASHSGEYPIFSSPDKCNVSADVIIDFSHPSVTSSLIRYALSTKTPAVIATTGLSGEQVDTLREASLSIPIFFSANMSLGVNLLVELAKKAAKALGNDFDIEIIEKHHNQKVDAPSGTALMIADAISSELENEPQYTYDRHSRRAKRSKTEIGIHAVRGGTIVGEHEIIFAGHDEIVTLSHSAMSKEIFCTGAINAALFLAGQKPGLYNMADLV